MGLHLWLFMSNYSTGTLKRLLDLTLSTVVLPFALLAVLLGALAIFISTGSNPWFTQTRIGLHGRTFKIHKLRTLRMGANSDLSGMRANDPDIIWVGRVLRIWRIDELPQVINVLLGDMSWVGPRPERPHIVDRCLVEIPNYGKRHEVVPGITGLAQIANPNATPDENAFKLQYDLEYIQRASFLTDIRILWKTVIAIG